MAQQLPLMTPGPDLLTTKQAATFLGYPDPRQIHALKYRGVLQPVGVSDEEGQGNLRANLYRLADLQKHKDRLTRADQVIAQEKERIAREAEKKIQEEARRREQVLKVRREEPLAKWKPSTEENATAVMSFMAFGDRLFSKIGSIETATHNAVTYGRLTCEHLANLKKVLADQAERDELMARRLERLLDRLEWLNEGSGPAAADLG